MSHSPILVDCNALADFFVGEDPLKQAAEHLRRKFPLWIAPPLIRYEFGNVLRTYTRRGNLNKTDASLMMKRGLELVQLCEECTEEITLAEANESSLTFYDATYAACARKFGYKLYTRDTEILKNCPEFACSISAV